jgi:hypothetical protein
MAGPYVISVVPAFRESRYQEDTMRILVLASFLALAACDSPIFHQDRPGGSDYIPYLYNQYNPYLYSRSAQPPIPPAISHEQVVQVWRECDAGNEAACNWVRYGHW